MPTVKAAAVFCSSACRAWHWRRLHRAVPAPEQVQRLAPTGAFPIARLAQNLGTTTPHARYLLAEHPVDWSPPRYRQTQDTAQRVQRMAEPVRERWAVLSLPAIADREHVGQAAVRLALRKQARSVPSKGRRPPTRDLNRE
ncbi:hypothetical protein [Streptomyces sp. NPDC058755]|uniref:hypothetical protein n=1 Tax=Streptomyces sp. NPDC058755 TaxID=3346624 RepID=UPI0036D0A941